MKSFIAKRVISILVNLRYLRFNPLKYKENNKEICNTFDHNFQKYSVIYNEKGIIRKVLFCIIQWCPYLKMSKMALNPFCDKTLQIQNVIFLKVIKDRHLFGIIFILLFIDVVILVTKQIIDPYYVIDDYTEQPRVG